MPPQVRHERTVRARDHLCADAGVVERARSAWSSTTSAARALEWSCAPATIGHTFDGRCVAFTAAHDHVDAINDAVQRIRLTTGQLQPDAPVWIAAGEVAHPGDVVATRRNDRELRTSAGEPVRNRDLWDVVSTHLDGSLTVSHRAGRGVVTLPPDYAHEHVGAVSGSHRLPDHAMDDA